MHGLILLADGFEDVEALAPRDLLIRAGVKVTTTSISNSFNVTTSHGVLLNADIVLSEVNSDSYDFVILPGGGRGTQNLLKSELVSEVVLEFAKEHKLICAICAAPMVLAKLGLLRNKRYTCFAGCNEGLDGIFTGREVEHDDNIITGRSMLYSVPFGLEIIKTLLGDEIKQKIYKQIEGK